MHNNKNGALPTNKNNENFKTVNGLYFHYINHTIGDLPEIKGNLSPKMRVFDRIIGQYLVKYHKKFENLTRSEIEASAKEAVLVAANKYLAEKKYQKNFDFCKFASNYLKFFLKLYFYKKTIDKSYGKLADNDLNRKIYFNINKWKKELKIENNSFLTNKQIQKIALHAKIDFEDIKKVLNFLNSREINIHYHNSNEEKLIKETDKNIDLELSDNYLEKNHNNQQVTAKFRKIISDYSKKLSKRDRKILINYSLFKKTNLKNLSSQFSLSQERIRQISVSEFDKFKNFIQSEKKNLELMN